MIPWLLLAAACTGAVSPAREDRAAHDTASGDTAVPGWPASIPACDGLLDPFPMADAADVAAAWSTRPSSVAVTSAMARVTDAASSTGCPSYGADPCGTGTTWEGACATDGVTAEGSAMADGCDDGGTWTFTGFSVVTADWRFAADGTLAAEMSGTERLEFDLTVELAGLCAGCDGRYAWSGTSVRDGVEDARHQRITAAPSADVRTGDWCLDQQVAPVASCPAEGVGWTALQGDAAAVVIWDGDAVCDGCGALVVDGAPAGVFCAA